jgi:hypothetical protein
VIGDLGSTMFSISAFVTSDSGRAVADCGMLESLRGNHLLAGTVGMGTT